MAFSNTIEILIAAKDQASAVIRGAANSATAASAEVDKANVSLAKAASSLTGLGSTLSRDITLPILAVGAASGKMAYNFANQMELLHTNAGIAQSAIADLSTTVLNMAGETGQAPEKLAQGLYHVASAGNGIWDTSQQLDILKVAAEGANLGLANLDDTTYSLTSAMASGVKGVANATEMMATLNAIVGAGDMKMNDLNGALSTGILSTAATFGVSIQSVGAALATLTDNGEHADEAATRLRMSLALMTSPSGAATKQLEALGLTAENAKVSTEGMNAVFAKSGLSTTKLADDLRQPNGITVAIQDLKKHLEDAGLSISETDAMLSKAFGGGRTDAALLTLLQNTDRMDAKFQAITNDAGQFQNKLNDLNNTPQQKIRDAWAGMQADLIKVGSQLLPIVATALSTVSNRVSDLVGWWGTLNSGQQAAIGYAVAAFAAAGPLLLGIGNAIRSIQAIGTVFSAVGGLVGGGMTMGSIATAGALADIAAVAAAVAAVMSAINAMNGAKAAAESDLATTQSMINRNAAIQASGVYSAETKARWAAAVQKAVASDQQLFSIHTAPAVNNSALGGFIAIPHALGTNFAPGGLSLVGENGPELVNLPTGSKVYNNKDSKAMAAGSRGVTINGGMHIYNQMDEQKFLAKLGWKLASA